MKNHSPPVVGFVAYSGTGKTTLLVKLIPILKKRGVRIGVVKCTHHDFEIDQPGKDSFELRKSGAAQTLLASSRRRALITEYDTDKQFSLNDMIATLNLDELDIVLIEGYKNENFPKIELYRAELDKPLLYPNDDSIIAIASNDKISNLTSLPLLDINQPELIANFITQTFLSKKVGDPYNGK